MQTIITPTDFSPASLNACFYAAKMAQDLHAGLLLAHVVEVPASVKEYSDVFDMANASEAKEKLQDLLDTLCIETNNQVNIEATIIAGDVEQELNKLCINEKPFAVVMATNTNNAMERFFTGSTTMYTASHLRFPVIVVPLIVKYKPINKLALACDLKNLDELPAYEIETIARKFNAELEIFHVSKERHIDSNHSTSKIFEELLPGTHCRFYETQNEDITAAIYSLTRTHDINMLMVTRKKHGLFYKSHFNELVFHAHIPTMVLHTDDVMEKV
jgi:nucleotide-binding universal stress UspA family protein